MTGCTLIPATRDSTLRQRDRANCAVYQFDRSVRDQKLIMRDLEKNGYLYHYSWNTMTTSLGANRPFGNWNNYFSGTKGWIFLKPGYIHQVCSFRRDLSKKMMNLDHQHQRTTVGAFFNKDPIKLASQGPFWCLRSFWKTLQVGYNQYQKIFGIGIGIWININMKYQYQYQYGSISRYWYWLI